MTSPATVLVIGSLAAQPDEILYLRSQITSLSSSACKINVLDTSGKGNSASAHTNIPESEVITPSLPSASPSDNHASSDAIEAYSSTVKQLVTEGKIHGVVAAGSDTLSVLAAAVMKDACPIGFPKLLVSTFANPDIRSHVEYTDITVMNSVVSVEGLNPMLKSILSNAAGAIAGMAMTYASLSKQMDDLKVSSGKKIAISTLSNTGPCVTNIRKVLTSTPHDASDFQIYVFNAAGTGSQAMERLIADGQVDAVVDLTAIEIAAELGDDSLVAGSNRLKSATKRGIPIIASVGACDTAYLGPKHRIPESAKGRNLVSHSPQITLMRTNKEENVTLGKHLTSKLKEHSQDPKTIRVVLPKGGLSALDQANVEKPTTSSAPPEAQTQPPSEATKGSAGDPWHDAEANAALFETIMTDLRDSGIEVFEYPDNINDDAFAISICEHLLEVMGDDPRKYRLANARRRKWSFDHGATMEKLRRRNSIEIPDAV